MDELEHTFHIEIQDPFHADGGRISPGLLADALKAGAEAVAAVISNAPITEMGVSTWHNRGGGDLVSIGDLDMGSDLGG